MYIFVVYGYCVQKWRTNLFMKLKSEKAKGDAIKFRSFVNPKIKT